MDVKYVMEILIQSLSFSPCLGQMWMDCSLKMADVEGLTTFNTYLSGMRPLVNGSLEKRGAKNPETHQMKNAKGFPNNLYMYAFH